jgi:hypothetical protein
MDTNNTHCSSVETARSFAALKFISCLILLATLFCSTELWGQSTPSDTTLETRKKLSLDLHKLRADRARLHRILAALNIVDSAYIVHFPTWLIRDVDVRERVHKVFRNRLKFPSRDSDLVVITNPSKTEIEMLSFGAVSMGREEVRLFVGDNLRKTILSEEYSRESTPQPQEPKKPIVLEPEPKSVFFEGSLFGGSIKFSNGWGAEMKMGNDAIGFPFWSSGSAEVVLLVDQLRIGAVVPMSVGLSESQIGGPFTIQSRKLNGAGGFTAEYAFNIASGSFDFHITSSPLSNSDANKKYTSLTEAYYVRSVVQGIYYRNLGMINNEHSFTLGVGMGYHQIGKARIIPYVDVNTTDKFDYYSPIIKVSYLRQGMHTYGVEVQGYSSTLLITSWIELVKDFIYADMKYSIPVFRGPNAWENSYFIMVSPRIRLSF